jgi:hypothetical protein
VAGARLVQGRGPCSVDPLASWNLGPAKQAIIAFIAAVTNQGSPDFVSPAERIATFDNDGTLGCEDFKALSAQGERGLARLVAATHTGMSTDEFNRIATD